VNYSEFEITDGYVGSMGKSYKTANEQTMNEAIDSAVLYHAEKYTRSHLVTCIESGRSVNWRKSPNFYYDHSEGWIRRKRTAPKIETKKCACGHTVEKSQVMSASMGSSCPDCYDRMSN
jgi:hypothetical protein